MCKRYVEGGGVRQWSLTPLAPLIFDEAVSNLDQYTADHFARTINTLKGKVTMILITHQIPKGLHVAR